MRAVKIFPFCNGCEKDSEKINRSDFLFGKISGVRKNCLQKKKILQVGTQSKEWPSPKTLIVNVFLILFDFCICLFFPFFLNFFFYIVFVPETGSTQAERSVSLLKIQNLPLNSHGMQDIQPEAKFLKVFAVKMSKLFFRHYVIF